MLRLSPASTLSLALLTVVALGLAWVLQATRAENSALRIELGNVWLAQRAAASHQSLASDALRRAAKLEDALNLMRKELVPATEPDSNRAAELERVVIFLREEIKAAHETIERLKQDEAPKEPATR